MSRNAYHYSIIRFVPNPVREEALNLGVVLIDAEGQFGHYRMLARIKSRMRLLAPRFDPRLVDSFEDDLQALIGIAGSQRRLGGPDGGINLEDLRRIAETHANQIQFTDPRAYLTENPEDALDDLFKEFVRPRRYARGQQGGIDRQHIKAEIVQTFVRWNLEPPNYPRRVEVEGQTGRHIFDYGLKNGQIRAAIYAVSFQMAMLEDIMLHRDHVAWAAYDIHQKQPELSIVAVTSPPLPQAKGLYDESLNMLRGQDVEVVRHDKFYDMRDRLVTTLFSNL